MYFLFANDTVGVSYCIFVRVDFLSVDLFVGRIENGGGIMQGFATVAIICLFIIYSNSYGRGGGSGCTGSWDFSVAEAEIPEIVVVHSGSPDCRCGTWDMDERMGDTECLCRCGCCIFGWK